MKVWKRTDLSIATLPIKRSLW